MMQYGLLVAMLAVTGAAAGRIHRLQASGAFVPAAHCRRLAGIGLGMTILLAMIVQEIILWQSGLLTPATGLPLHLCSLSGLITLPMLLTRQRSLQSFSLFVGAPGAALALLFPAVLTTPWPVLTNLAFHVMHAGLVCAPLLPLAEGWRPSPSDALLAGGCLLLAGITAQAANFFTGGNYLFLAGPVTGTPLMLLAQWGLSVYRILLAVLAGVILIAEAGLCILVRRRYSQC